MGSGFAGDDTLDRLIAPLAVQSVEIVMLLYIDLNGRLNGIRYLRGHRDWSEVPIRVLVADALAFEASAAFMAHNHPGGEIAASAADLAVTRRLARAFEAVNVSLIDHLVVAPTGSTSLRRAGYL